MPKTILAVQHFTGELQVNPQLCKHTNQMQTYGFVGSAKSNQEKPGDIPIWEHHSICLDCLLIDPPTFHESIVEANLHPCLKSNQKG